MIKKIYWMFFIILSFTKMTLANDTPTFDDQELGGLTEQLADLDNDIENIDPTIDIPVPPEPEPTSSWWFKLRLLKEYCILQAALAKQHVVDHRQLYLVASALVALGILAAGTAAYVILHNKKSHAT